MSIYESKFDTNTSTITSIRSSSSSTSTGARACVRAYAREEDGEEQQKADIQDYQIRSLCKYYEESFGRHCPPVVEREIGDALSMGMSGELIESIMDETQLAPHPSWAYARAIMRRCFRELVYTDADFRRGRGIL